MIAFLLDTDWLMQVPAGRALEHGHTLLPFNLWHFTRVPNLRICPPQ
jgi:hypothetical protein